MSRRRDEKESQSIESADVGKVEDVLASSHVIDTGAANVGGQPADGGEAHAVQAATNASVAGGSHAEASGGAGESSQGDSTTGQATAEGKAATATPVEPGAGARLYWVRRRPETERFISVTVLTSPRTTVRTFAFDQEVFHVDRPTASAMIATGSFEIAPDSPLKPKVKE